MIPHEYLISEEDCIYRTLITPILINNNLHIDKAGTYHKDHQLLYYAVFGDYQDFQNIVSSYSKESLSCKKVDATQYDIIKEVIINGKTTLLIINVSYFENQDKQGITIKLEWI